MQTRDELENLTEDLRRLFVEAHSATADNRAAAANLKFGVSKRSESPHQGLLVGDTLVSDIFYSLESGTEIPAEVRNDFPELSLSEWHAALRLVVAILSSTERQI